MTEGGKWYVYMMFVPDPFGMFPPELAFVDGVNVKAKIGGFVEM